MLLSPSSLTIARLTGANFTFAFTFSDSPHYECLSLASVFPYLWRLPIATVRHRADDLNIGHQHICKPNIKIWRLEYGFRNSHGCLHVYLERLAACCVPGNTSKVARAFSTLIRHVIWELSIKLFRIVGFARSCLLSTCPS
jgi:hypothetical protein